MKALKKVPSDAKGLSKLPTSVRNKMGYMKEGGKVKGAGKEHFKKGAAINKEERQDIKNAKRTAKMNRAQRASDARKPSTVYKDTKKEYGTSRSYKAYEDGDLKSGYKAADSKEMKYTLKERLDNRKKFKAEKKKLVSQAKKKAMKKRMANDAEYAKKTGRSLR